jgi:hypothetical protein
LKNDVKVLSKSTLQKSFLKKNSFFVGILKVNDENRRIRIRFRIRIRIRIRIHTKISWIRNTPQGGEEEAERARSAQPTAPESLRGTAGFFGEARSYATPAERRQVGGLSVMLLRLPFF